MSAITMLSDREHIRQRVGMYAGSTTLEKHERFMFGEYKTVEYIPALVKIIDEIIDNSFDEYIRTEGKFANKIELTFNGNLITVKDNGRGIPQRDIITPEGESIPGPVAAWTRTKAGSNFDDTNRITMGMNGVGSSVTNFLSSQFQGITGDGENTIMVNCTDGGKNISWKKMAGGRQGTSVTFMPDFDEIFGGYRVGEAVKDIIKDRITAMSIVFPDIEFKIDGKKHSTSFKKYAQLFGNSIVIDTPLCSISFCTSPDGFRQQSFVNGLNIKNGGSHIDMVIDQIVAELIPMIKRKYKIEITKARVKECLTMVMFIRNMPNLKFDSQTKERLTNTHGEVKNHINLDYAKIAKQIIGTEDIIQPIIEAVLARKLAAEKAAATKASKAAAKSKVQKHIKAGYYGRGEDTTLFLAEGDSAIGMLLKVRDPKMHGGFALRGKFINTWGMKDTDVIKNKEALNIMTILGLEFDKPANISYRNIGILVDGDLDGVGSIFPLLLAFFSRWPDLFEKNKIRFIRSPIVIATGKKDSKWYYSIADYEKDKNKLKSYEVRYIKGLGSLRDYEYKKIVNEQVYDTIKLEENYKEVFEVLFGDDADKRKDWMS